MPRPVQAPDPDDIPEAERDAYERVIGRQLVHQNIAAGAVLKLMPYHAALAAAPAPGVLISELGRVFRGRGELDGSYSHADREWVDQVLSIDHGFNGFLRSHTLDGVSAGIRIEAIEALRAGHLEDLTDDERLLTTFIRGVHLGTLTDETWNLMEARLGQRGAIEYAMFVMFLQLVMRLFQAFGSPDIASEEIDGLIEGIKNGTVDVGDFRERIN